jgi:hypothetical protein
MKLMRSHVRHWLVPHYTNNHRPKLIQPVGLALVAAFFVVLEIGIKLISLAPVLPAGFVLGYASSISADQVVEITNAERAKADLPPLSVNNLLNQAALAKANHMFANDYWSHVAPDGSTPWNFIRSAGYAYSVAGENLARDFDDTGSMIRAWMASETHKANIVHPKYSEIGIAVVNGKLQGVETTLVVQMFGVPPTGQTPKTTEKAATDEAPQVAAQPKPEPVVVEVAALEPVIEPIPVPEPTSQPAAAEPQLLELNQATLEVKTDGAEAPKMVSPLDITKAVGTSLIVLLVLVLAYDTVMVSKKNLPRRVGNNWAHIGFLGVILFIIVVMTQGKVI